jgi:23S rRNA (cytidine1920-2'-O)/16S rRNA (cytidine1409-2'-O)-methyltransferase
MAASRQPLDRALVARGLAADLDVARTLVRDGRVLVAGAPGLSPLRLVAAAEPLVVVAAPRFVGRGGDKLEGALERFVLDVAGRVALDVGASTGGFTDCLLQRGCARVLAVDVGRAQLHERLCADPRVVSLERTNVAELGAEAVRAALGRAPELVTADLSFTSLAHHMPTLVAVAAHDADLVVLVKPQFEVDHATASRGRGVVTDPVAWREALERCASATRAAGAGIMGAMASPLLGAAGNVEFFVHAAAGAPDQVDVATVLDRAVAEAGDR